MKKAGVIIVLTLVLSGCDWENRELERGMELRTKLLKAEEVSFRADISADYGDSLQLFSMNCLADPQGNVRFEVTAPDTIAGITGTVEEGSGALTFDGTALHFDLLTDEQLTPVSAPWILLRTLRSGYLTGAGTEDDELRLTIDDSYEDNALQLDVWMDRQDFPQFAQILYDGKSILSVKIEDFQIR